MFAGFWMLAIALTLNECVHHKMQNVEKYTCFKEMEIQETK